MAGLLPAGADRSQHRSAFVENLRFAARELSRHGRMLLIEPINNRDMPSYFLDTQAEAHAICAEVGESNLMVQMDFYHVQVAEGDIATKLRKYLTHVGHIQIAGLPERNEPNNGKVNSQY